MRHVCLVSDGDDSLLHKLAHALGNGFDVFQVSGAQARQADRFRHQEPDLFLVAVPNLGNMNRARMLVESLAARGYRVAAVLNYPTYVPGEFVPLVEAGAWSLGWENFDAAELAAWVERVLALPPRGPWPQS